MLCEMFCCEISPNKNFGDFISSSGFWEQYARQASKGGDGRLNPADEDPRLWLPTMVAPVLGNPSAHTLREFHYQSRCFGLMQRHETRLREK